MKGKLVWSIFWALVAMVVVIAGVFIIPSFVPAFRDLFKWLLGISGAAFFLLGVALIVLTVREKAQGILKIFLILTGASTVGWPVSVLLHNVVSGLFNIEVPVFFIMALFVCPTGFLVGAVGTIVLAIKHKRIEQSS